LSTTLQKRVASVLTPAVPQIKELNAETVTTIATGFLKRIGNKGGLKAKRVSLEESIYTVEVDMKKLMAIVQVDAKTHEIRSYEIQAKGEETSSFSVSPKMVMIMFGVSAVAYVALYFTFKMLGL
jgi:hypothetical protein